MSSIFIQDIIVGTKLTWDWKVRDQIDTIEKLGTKLKYGVNDRDQIYSLPKKILDKFQSRIHVTHLNSNDFFPNLNSNVSYLRTYTNSKFLLRT